ncbi:MAG: FtsW/RodA/SpoVE family cell cycle protein [Bacilli bacterium]|nr:FtsW/RodA/SpoVE family cell cycle protein [Bacilli bacterium]
MQKVNLKIIIPILLLSIISILSIYSALTYTSSVLGNLALKQAIWYGIGWILVLIIYHYKNDFLYEKAWIFYLFGNISLLLLLFFGTPINNSRCWFTIPGVGTIQPSEFMKIFLMLMLGKMIHDFRNNYKNPTNKEEFIFLLKSFLIFLIPSILTFLQPDTGAVLIYFVIYCSMMFVSGLRFRWFASSFFLIIFFVGTIFYLYFFQEKMFISIFGTSLYYRFDRIFNWHEGSGLQLENALAAIGSAGLTGHGFNKTPIYFPESSTDFIFAVYASNFGFIGVCILISIIVFLDLEILILAKKRKIEIDRFLISGIFGMLLFQQVQNIGMTIGLFPITGITLPFVSYGGSSLLSYMLLVGILINISSQKVKKYTYQ